MSKQDLIGANVAHYLQQARHIFDNLRKLGAKKYIPQDDEYGTGDDGDLFYGDNQDKTIMEIARMLRDEDHLIRTIESK